MLFIFSDLLDLGYEFIKSLKLRFKMSEKIVFNYKSRFFFLIVCTSVKKLIEINNFVFIFIKNDFSFC